MPYTVGVTASLLISTFLLLSMLPRDASFVPEVATVGSSGSPLMLSNSIIDAPDSMNSSVSSEDLIRSRSQFAAESPSLNPQGSLVAVSRSFDGGNMNDEEVVVVADVFGDGHARIAQVVEPTDDPRVIRDLQKAFETDLASPPFVPNTLEDRPETVRVVLKLTTVHVSTGLGTSRTTL